MGGRCDLMAHVTCCNKTLLRILILIERCVTIKLKRGKHQMNLRSMNVRNQ